MEWPNIEVVTVDDEEDRYYNYYYGTDPSGERLDSDRTATLVTKEIYARAAKASISNILVDHSETGLEDDVHDFLERLRRDDVVGGGADDDDSGWNVEYRNVARSFAELMAEATPLARTLEICRGGLDAVHDLLKYRLPRDDFDDDDINNNNNNNNKGSDTVLSARDAFVLCQSFPKLSTRSVTGTRPPDLSYRYGLLTVSPDSNEAYAGDVMNHHNRDHDGNNNNNNSGGGGGTTLTVYGNEACERIAGMRQAGQLETSAASLACHTLTNHELVTSMSEKTFVVIGCDHPLAPTKSLLRIPGVTVLGIPSSREGLRDLLEYVAYNAPDDSTFVYPDLENDENPVLTRGPHVAQWILDNTKFLRDDDDEVDDHLSSYARTNAGSELVLVPMPLPSPTIDIDIEKKPNDDPSNNNNVVSSTRVRESSIRWAAASDLVVQRVLRARSESVRCSLWLYQSSTTCMVVPAASTTKSTEMLRRRPFHEPYLHKLSLGTVLKPTVEDRIEEKKKDDDDENDETTTNSTRKSKTRRDNHDYTIVNGILTLEGPHHMLAEHIRLWRAIATHFPDEYQGYGRGTEDDDPSETEYDDDDLAGSRRREVYVFAPHVPLSLATSTTSPSGGVLPVPRENARLLDDPLRIFDAGAVASILAAIGIAGLADPIVNRPMPCVLTSGEEDTTPFAMFWYGSFHGGIWNCPYTLESVSGTVGYVLGKAYEYYYHYYYHAAGGMVAPPGEEDDDDDNRSPRDGEKEDDDLPDFVQERLEMFAGP